MSEIVWVNPVKGDAFDADTLTMIESVRSVRRAWHAREFIADPKGSLTPRSSRLSGPWSMMVPRWSCCPS